MRVGLAIRDWVEARRAERAAAGQPYWSVRVGLHAGPLVTGLVGLRKLSFDAWGDTLNVGSRLQTAGEPGRVNASRAFVECLAGASYRADARGPIAGKGKAPIEMYWLERC